jgi:aminobenzoyl-glutamate utilization protein B
MFTRQAGFVVVALCAIPWVSQAASPSPAKRAAVASVTAHSGDLISLSDKIWAYAETALREHKSSKLSPTSPSSRALP